MNSHHKHVANDRAYLMFEARFTIQRRSTFYSAAMAAAAATVFAYVYNFLVFTCVIASCDTVYASV